MAKYKVLSTKKLEPSLLKQAREKDIEIIEQEFISVKPIRSPEKLKEIIRYAESGKQFIVFTSANAVEAVDKYMHVGDTYYVIAWKMFCLSGKTKQAILNAEFLEKDVICEAENATALAGKIIEQKVGQVVFFCGNKRRDELPSILRNAGITVHEVVVYETVETPVAVRDTIDGILFFSPSAVQSFFSVNQLKQDAVCFAIGQTTADSVVDYCDNKIIISESPSRETMLASVNFYFQNKAFYE